MAVVKRPIKATKRQDLSTVRNKTRRPFSMYLRQKAVRNADESMC